MGEHCSDWYYETKCFLSSIADAELGFPRRAHADDVYKGMFIPKGAVILANSRSISRHEHGKGSPNDFDPTRFLEGGGARPVRDYVFGFGRR